MKYVQWRDELESYLRDTPAEEKKKIFAYYGEMYADRRDAGMDEEEIVKEFGAPYDAAQKIVQESRGFFEERNDGKSKGVPPPPPVQPTPPANGGDALNSSAQPQTTAVKKKHTVLKVLGVILGIIIAAALIIIFIALGKSASIKFTVENFTTQTKISAADIQLTMGEAECTYYDGDSVTVEYPDCSDFGYTVSEKDGKLTIEPDARRRGGMIFSIAMSVRGWDMPKVVIKLPRSNAVDLSLGVSAGTFVLGEGKYGNVDLDMSAGVLKTGKIECKKLQFNLSAGTASEISADCDSLIVHQSAGSVNFGNSVCKDVDVRLSAGTIGFSSLVCDTLNMHVSAGSATVNVDGKRSDYTISADVSAGSCNVSDQRGDDPLKRVDASVSAGSVNINFSR